jgi:hypothetical protein
MPHAPVTRFRTNPFQASTTSRPSSPLGRRKTRPRLRHCPPARQASHSRLPVPGSRHPVRRACRWRPDKQHGRRISPGIRSSARSRASRSTNRLRNPDPHPRPGTRRRSPGPGRRCRRAHYARDARPGHHAPPVADAADDEDDDADTEEAEAPRSPALSQALWAAAATLLTLAILAQGALVFRNEIALSSPQLRPALESLCAGLGCDLPLPRHAADIAIESSDIQPDASREAYFTLHATLRNRAEFQQTWPHVEITLTDARDKALVRRVLEPAQWLPADAPRDAFPARGEAAIRVAFEAPGVAAAGYRVYAFYP